MSTDKSSNAHSTTTNQATSQSTMDVYAPISHYPTTTTASNAPQHYLQPTMPAISHSSSLSTVALSTSCGSLSTSFSSAYSLSTINSDLELGHFINENTLPQQQPGHQGLFTEQPYRRLKSTTNDVFCRHIVQLDADTFRRRLRAAISLQLTPWECIVYALFAFYLWLLVGALMGETRVIKTCAASSFSELGSNGNTSFMDAETNVSGVGGLVEQSYAMSGLGKEAGFDHVAREHLVPPTYTPHPLAL